MERMKLVDEVKWVLEKLNEYGKGYIVGGYIRDYLLGIEPKDCDFCTDIEYEKLKEIFKENSPKEIGKAFGIIQIIYKGKSYEIAKLRKDISFTKDRNITEIEFINDIYEDLKRRDFTINAIAFDGEKMIYSSKKSKEDIENKVLRFVGDAKTRIEEDPLRILRGVRIAGEKELKILEETEVAMKAKKNDIKRISIERVQDEFFKILRGKNSKASFSILNEIGVFEELFPETYKENKISKVLDIFKKIDNLKEMFSDNSLNIKLAVIFAKTKEELLILKLDNKSKKSILNIIENKDKIKEISDKYSLKKIILKIGIEDFKNILVLEELSSNVCNVRDLLEEIISKKETIFLKDLEISGRDLINVEIKDGKKIKIILDEILDLVLKNPDYNKKDYLIKLIEGEKF
ncbi:MAG: CCA tRNA nucleotidyltransferase [Cetobacterium sp.]